MCGGQVPVDRVVERMVETPVDRIVYQDKVMSLPTPYTPHPTPHTLRPTPYTLQPTYIYIYIYIYI